MSVNQDRIQGFTLIELSVVLVIIGLIVGGVLVGQDLIHAAQLRAQISQIEKYKTAVQTFAGKYNCLPGDCPNALSLGLGLTGTAIDNGDGDGYIAANQAVVGVEKETLNFWYHLYAANLIETACAGYDGVRPFGPAYSSPLIRPNAKLSDGQTGIWPSSYDLQTLVPSYFFITDAIFNGGGLTPLDAQNYDIKTDDGYPMTGQVRATGDGASISWLYNYTIFNCPPGINTYVCPNGVTIPPFSSTAACVNNQVSPTIYNTKATAFTCSLSVVAGF